MTTENPIKLKIKCDQCGASMSLKKEQVDKKNYCDKCAFDKVWDRTCEVCRSKPVVRATGLCGPCTFGEAETVGGNW